MGMPDVKIVIAGVDKFSKQLKGPAKSLQAFGKSMQSTGKRMTMGLTLPIAAFGVAALKTAGQFQESMLRVQNLTGASEEQFSQLNSQARELGKSTIFSATQAADAMGFLGMAGFETTEIMNAMPATLDLAAASQMELAGAADIVSNILTGFNMKAEETGRVSDILVKGFQSSNTNLQQLGDAMSFVAPIAATMNLSIEESTAAIGLLSNAGIQGGRAGTGLRKILSSLAKPTAEAARVMNRLQIPKKNLVDASGNIMSLRNVIESFQKSGATAADYLTIFGQRGGPGMAALIKQGLPEYDKLIGRLTGAEGAAADAAEVFKKSLPGQLKLLNSAFQELQLQMADAGLIDFASKVITKLGELVQWFSFLDEGTKKSIMKFAGLIAIAGPIIMVFGSIISAIGTIVGAFGALMPIITAVASVFSFLWSVLQVLFFVFQAFVAVLGGPFIATIIGVIAAVVALGIAIFQIYKNWDMIVTFIKDVFTGAIIVLGDTFKNVAEVILRVFNPVIEMLSKVFEYYNKIKNIGGNIGAKISSFIFGKDDKTNAAVDSVQKNNSNSTFNGTMTFKNTPAGATTTVSESGGLTLEVDSGKQEVGMAY